MIGVRWEYLDSRTQGRCGEGGEPWQGSLKRYRKLLAHSWLPRFGGGKSLDRMIEKRRKKKRSKIKDFKKQCVFEWL